MSRTCPCCGQDYEDYPAISRKDNRTEICPVCGMKEALANCGLSAGTINQILAELKEMIKQIG